MRIAIWFILVFLLSCGNVLAQSHQITERDRQEAKIILNQYNNYIVEMKKTRQIFFTSALVHLHPGLIEVKTKDGGTRKSKSRGAVGSGHIIFSSYVESSDLCKAEEKFLTDSLNCDKKTFGKYPRSYILTAAHVVDVEEDTRHVKKKTEKKDQKTNWFLDFFKRLYTMEMEEESEVGKQELPENPPYVTVTIKMPTNSDDLYPDEKEYPGTVVAFDGENDLALIRIDDKSIMPFVAKIAPKDVDLRPTRTVWSVGYPLGSYGPVITQGLLSGIKEKIGNKKFVLSSAPITKGNSGGGTFHPSKIRDRFELIGVARAIAASRYGLVSHVVFSVGIEEVHNFLESNHFGFVLKQ